ncbi:uncharacterized protein G2W53_017151 [Senna tora]|uniref:Uncharacterized protein n=1 Tax=Senna tora TaxID=362788 RepID=A0A834TRC7_9FABA|nr:uncharacterized protein G2W53_017151 [Senna tora]
MEIEGEAVMRGRVGLYGGRYRQSTRLSMRLTLEIGSFILFSLGSSYSYYSYTMNNRVMMLHYESLIATTTTFPSFFGLQLHLLISLSVFLPLMPSLLLLLPLLLATATALFSLAVALASTAASSHLPLLHSPPLT